MILKCGVQNDEENLANPIYTCHHCGMPVCAAHGWVLLADDAFDDSVTPGSRDSSRTPASRAAMHCPACVDDHHKGAAKQRGWADQKATQAAARAQAGPMAMPEQDVQAWTVRRS